jgi:hypothetical protein
MIKRNPNPVRERNLPITTNDSNQTTNSLPKTYNQTRRRSTGKSSVLLRIIGGTLLCFVAFLYVFGTRHILLISLPIPASSSGRESINNAVDKTDDNNRGKGNGNKKSETDSRRRQPSSFSQKPRTLGYYYALADSESFVGTERLDPNLKILYDNHKSGILRGEFMTKEEKKRQHYLLDSKSYEGGEAETMEDQGGHCVAQYKWQEKSFPTCNHLMEIDMTNLNFLPMFHENHYNNKHSLPLASSSLHSYSRLLANGYWRDVWSIENLLRYKGEQEETFILKTMRYKHDYEARNYDRHRRDAVAMEQLTASEFIMDIYAACGNSGLFQYADGGSLDDSIWYNYNISDKDKEKPWSPKEKLIIAYQAVSGLADLHNFAKEGVPAVAHTDVGPDQFVYVNEAGVYKLNDFNRARFIAKNEMTEELCTYKVGNNPGVVSATPIISARILRTLFSRRLRSLTFEICSFSCCSVDRLHL